MKSSDEINYNFKFKFAINEIPLLENDMHILIYLIDIETNKDILVRKASINVGEIYVYNKPINKFIPLENSKKVNIFIVILIIIQQVIISEIKNMW